jgi:integrase
MRGCRPLTPEEVKEVSRSFTGKFTIRNLALFSLGINTGFRITELLSIRLGDVLNDEGKIPTRLQVKRQNMKGKTSSRSVLLNASARRHLSSWLALPYEQKYSILKTDFVFVSGHSGKPISRAQYWKILKAAFKKAGVDASGTHVMRKTYSNNIYQHLLARLAAGENVDPFRATSKALGHASISSTDAYLSFLTSDVDNATLAIGVQK